MGVVASAAGGTGQQITIKTTGPAGGELDRVLVLSPIGPAVRAHFVRALKTRAWRELDTQKQFVDPERFRRIETDIIMAMTAGKYEWGDEIHSGMNTTRTGSILDLLSRVRPLFPDATEADVDAMVEQHGWDKLFKLCNLADGIPAPKTEAPQTDGAQSDTTTKNGLPTLSTGSPDSASKT